MRLLQGRAPFAAPPVRRGRRGGGGGERQGPVAAPRVHDGHGQRRGVAMVLFCNGEAKRQVCTVTRRRIRALSRPLPRAIAATAADLRFRWLHKQAGPRTKHSFSNSFVNSVIAAASFVLMEFRGRRCIGSPLQ